MKPFQILTNAHTIPLLWENEKSEIKVKMPKDHNSHSLSHLKKVLLPSQAFLHFYTTESGSCNVAFSKAYSLTFKLANFNLAVFAWHVAAGLNKITATIRKWCSILWGIYLLSGYRCWSALRVWARWSGSKPTLVQSESTQRQKNKPNWVECSNLFTDCTV